MLAVVLVAGVSPSACRLTSRRVPTSETAAHNGADRGTDVARPRPVADHDIRCRGAVARPRRQRRRHDDIIDDDDRRRSTDTDDIDDGAAAAGSAPGRQRPTLSTGLPYNVLDNDDLGSPPATITDPASQLRLRVEECRSTRQPACSSARSPMSPASWAIRLRTPSAVTTPLPLYSRPGSSLRNQGSPGLRPVGGQRQAGRRVHYLGDVHLTGVSSGRQPKRRRALARRRGGLTAFRVERDGSVTATL